MVTRTSIKRFALAVLFALPVAAPVAVSAANDAAPGAVKHQSKLYIVQMADPPVVAYTGGIAGLKATKPSRGKKIDPQSPDVVRYADHLRAKHDAALARVGGANKAYSYKFAFNGFAAELSDAQAEALKATPGVIAVSKDEARALDTSSTPAFLGLSGPGGLWEQLAASASRRERHHRHRRRRHLAGEPELLRSHRHQRQRDQGRQARLPQIPGWHGRCVPGEQFNASNCNQKLIGAQYYNAGWGGNAGIDAQLPWEFNSPRDFGGHGTHTASTAGGNTNVPTTGRGGRVRRHQRHRAARPHRRVQGLLGDRRPAAAASRSDSVAAIDQAVADGVDVINFSISGSHDQLPRPGRDRLPVRGRRGRVRRGLGRQQRPDHEHGRAPGSVADHGGRGHAQPRRRGLGDAGQRRDLHRRLGGDPGRPGAAHRLDRRRPAGRRPDAARAVLRRRPTAASSSIPPRWPARSSSATAA